MKSIDELYNEITDRIETIHINKFKDHNKPLFLISETYPGVWLEHVYDSVLYAKMNPNRIDIACNVVNLFIDNQKEDGQLPCYIWDGNKAYNDNLVGFGQIQECVSFASLCYEVFEMTNDISFLQKAYQSCSKWAKWLKKRRMISNRGLIEMFVGYDTGHDNSCRFEKMAHKEGCIINGENVNASVFANDDDVTPILTVDMNCNYYATLTTLSKMAKILGNINESEKWNNRAKKVKQKIFEYLFDEEDCFFYDVDRYNQKRKYLSSTILHLFLEKVLDKNEDKELIEKLLKTHILNKNEFWTEYPFPSVAINEPRAKKNASGNCWGYFSQGLIALRCIRWMDYYGLDKEMDILCEKWVSAWTNCYEEVKFGQELDPVTGKPSPTSQWYSSCMLFYIYSVNRLKMLSQKES